jgi:cytidine deaminase
MLALGRGERLSTLALREARPCAHCRQVLAEIDGALGGDEAGGLRLVDPTGRALHLADLYPLPFAPEALGTTGCVPGTEPWPALAVHDYAVPPDAIVGLVEAGRRAHAPYSRAPAAVALRRQDGGLATGTVLESVAFNPTIGPVQDALVGLVAAGHSPEEVVAAWLAMPREADVSHEAAARDAVAAIAPGAPVHVTYWS